MLQIAGKCIFQCKLKYLVKATLQSGLTLYYIVYGSTDLFIANLICLANIPTPDLIINHLQNLTASCFCFWSTGLTERKLPMQLLQAQRPMPRKHGNQVCIFLYLQVDHWHTVVSLNSCDLFLFILVTRMKRLDYCKIVEENFNFVAKGILERT